MELFDPGGSKLSGLKIADLGPGERIHDNKTRVDWFEPYRDLRWTLKWQDHLGGAWVRTHRGDVHRL